MTDRWVTDDEDYPDGHLVPMAPSEQAQHDADQIAGAAVDAWLAGALEQAAARRATITQAREGLADGTLFSSLSSDERGVMGALLAQASV